MTSTEFQLRHHHLIGDREKLDALRDVRRAGLLALADYLTDLDAYPDPWRVFAAHCPGVPLDQIEEWASELLRLTVKPGVNPFDVEVALDYLTGVRP